MHTYVPCTCAFLINTLTLFHRSNVILCYIVKLLATNKQCSLQHFRFSWEVSGIVFFWGYNSGSRTLFAYSLHVVRCLALYAKNHQPTFGIIWVEAEIDLAKIMINFENWTLPRRGSELSNLLTFTLKYSSFPDTLCPPLLTITNTEPSPPPSTPQTTTQDLAAPATRNHRLAPVMRKRIHFNDHLDVVLFKIVSAVKVHIAEIVYTQAKFEECLTVFTTNALPKMFDTTIAPPFKTF